jgi:hypothetical protein
MQGKKRDIVGATWSLSTRIAEEFLIWYVVSGMLPRRHPAQFGLICGSAVASVSGNAIEQEAWKWLGE